MVAGIHNLAAKLAGAFRIIDKTTTATLTTAEIMDDGLPFIRCTTADTAWVLTLPAAVAQYEGRVVLVANWGHATNTITVNVVAGYGAQATNDDSVVNAGEVAEFICDGTYWFANGSTVPEA